MVAWIAAAGVDVFAIAGSRCDAFGRCPCDFPEELPGEWIEACYQIAAGHDQLVLAEQVHKDRRWVVW